MRTISKLESSTADVKTNQYEEGDLLRLTSVTAIVDTSVTTVLRWVSEGKFPEPIKYNGCKRWLRSEVQAFLSNAASNRKPK
jgi:predicted DNA-binding transcriptional regulator AlpA